MIKKRFASEKRRKTFLVDNLQTLMLAKKCQGTHKKGEKTWGCLPKAKCQKPKHIRGTEILIRFSQHKGTETQRFLGMSRFRP
jgi:hypothetical protein